MIVIKFDHKATSFSEANLAYLAHCANIAYKTKGELGDEFEDMKFDLYRDSFFIEDKKTDTQCFVVGDGDKIIVSFRGTEGKIKDIITDKKFFPTNFPTGKRSGLVHRGFYKAFNSVWKKIEEEIVYLRNNGQSVWFTGHSLGAALAIIAAATMRIQNNEGLNGVYVFGSPRVFDNIFAHSYDNKLKDKTYLFVNNNDFVTRVPTPPIYSHVGQLMYFSSKGKLYRDEDLSWWKKSWDKMKGHWDDFMKLGVDSIKDHRMNRYQELCEKVYKAIM